MVLQNVNIDMGTHFWISSTIAKAIIQIQSAWQSLASGMPEATIYMFQLAKVMAKQNKIKQGVWPDYSTYVGRAHSLYFFNTKLLTQIIETANKVVKKGVAFFCIFRNL